MEEACGEGRGTSQQGKLRDRSSGDLCPFSGPGQARPLHPLEGSSRVAVWYTLYNRAASDSMSASEAAELMTAYQNRIPKKASISAPKASFLLLSELAASTPWQTPVSP